MKLITWVLAFLGNLTLFVPGPALWAATVEYDLTIARQEMNFTGNPVEAMTINGQLPGPTLRFTEGDHAVIRVHNRMDVETSIHWHGPRYLIAELHPPYDFAAFTEHCGSVGLQATQPPGDRFQCNLPFAACLPAVSHLQTALPAPECHTRRRNNDSARESTRRRKATHG